MLGQVALALSISGGGVQPGQNALRPISPCPSRRTPGGRRRCDRPAPSPPGIDRKSIRSRVPRSSPCPAASWVGSATVFRVVVWESTSSSLAPGARVIGIGVGRAGRPSRFRPAAGSPAGRRPSLRRRRADSAKQPQRNAYPIKPHRPLRRGIAAPHRADRRRKRSRLRATANGEAVRPRRHSPPCSRHNPRSRKMNVHSHQTVNMTLVFTRRLPDD